MQDVRSIYGDAIWRGLREFAVWAPGTDVRLGDYGTMQDACFVRQGHLSDFGTFDFGEIRAASLTNLFLVSQNGVRNDLAASAGAAATAEFKFDRKAGAILVAQGLSTETYADLAGLSRIIEAIGDFDAGHRFVTSVRRYQAYSVLASSTAGGTIKLSASGHN